LKESIDENTNEKTKDFNDNYDGRLWLHGNQRSNGVWPFEKFDHTRVNREDEIRDGLDRYLRSIKMKILAFQKKII